jgi:hypothetical protein
MGAPIGNQNAVRAKHVRDALLRAAASDDFRRLRAGCEKVMDLFAQGEPWAVQFVADRLDGRPPQMIQGDSEAPVTTRLLIGG